MAEKNLDKLNQLERRPVFPGDLARLRKMILIRRGMDCLF
jgi:hypothetical protein